MVPDDPLVLDAGACWEAEQVATLADLVSDPASVGRDILKPNTIC